MTGAERRAKLKANQNMNVLWYAILVLQGIGVGLSIVAITALLFVAGRTGVTNGLAGMAVGVAGFFLLAYIGITVFFWFAIFALAKWMRILLWVNVVFSIFTGEKYYNFAIALLIAVAYMYVMKAVDGSKIPTAPVAPIAK